MVRVGDVEIDFIRTDHPALGFRKEDRLDLESASSVDILQGAFMGSVVFRIGGADFGTPPSDRGWRGLVEWCVRLATTVRQLDGGAQLHLMTEPDCNETVRFERAGVNLVVSSSRSEDCGTTTYAAFQDAAVGFLGQSLSWIAREYPGALRNRKSERFLKDLMQYVDQG